MKQSRIGNEQGFLFGRTGRLCTSACYKASELIPGYANRAQITSVTFVADIAQVLDR